MPEYNITAEISSMYIVPAELDQDGIGVTVEVPGPQGPQGPAGPAGGGGGGGDMLKSTYDTNNSGVVDRAEVADNTGMFDGKPATDYLLKSDYDPNGNGNKVAAAETADTAGFATDTFLFGGEDPSMYMKWADYVPPTLLEVLDSSNSAGTRIITNLGTPSNAYEAANKYYVDQVFNSGGRYRGDIDASTNPNYPAAVIGDRYEIRVAGRIGGASGPLVDVYDEIVCKADTVAGDHATVGASWYIIQGNLEKASETVNGYVRIATQSEVDAGTDPDKAIVPSKLASWWATIKGLALVFTNKIAVGASLGGYAKIEADAGADQAVYVRSSAIGVNSVATGSGIAQKGEAVNGDVFYAKSTGTGSLFKGNNGTADVFEINKDGAMTKTVNFQQRADFTISDLGNQAATVTWDLTKAVTRVVATGNPVINLSNELAAGAGGSFVLYFWQDATGGRVPTFQAGKYRNVPTSSSMNTTANGLTIFAGFYSGTDGRMTLSTMADTTPN